MVVASNQRGTSTVINVLANITNSFSYNTASDLDKVQLAPKLKTTSPVWKYFALEVDEKGKPRSDEEVVC